MLHLFTSPRDEAYCNHDHDKEEKWFFGLFTRTVRPYHDLKLTYLSTWGASGWHKFEIEARCKRCGAELGTFGLTHSELLDIIPQYVFEALFKTNSFRGSYSLYESDLDEVWPENIQDD